MVLTEEQKQYYNRSVADGVADDLVLLTDITENGVAQVLSARYERDDMYTSIGPVLIAVNPYRYYYYCCQLLSLI
jgi:myosin heavy subunit